MSVAPTFGNRFGGAFGYRDDGDIGLIHVGARYYDPINCRFVTRDSYLDQHPYVYCDGDPINFADPTGHGFGDVLRAVWDKVSGAFGAALEAAATPSVLVLTRTITIWATIGYLAIRAAKHFFKWMGGQAEEHPDSWGGLYGNSHGHQPSMVDKWSEPEKRDDNEADQ